MTTIPSYWDGFLSWASMVADVVEQSELDRYIDIYTGNGGVIDVGSVPQVVEDAIDARDKEMNDNGVVFLKIPGPAEGSQIGGVVTDGLGGYKVVIVELMLDLISGSIEEAEKVLRKGIIIHETTHAKDALVSSPNIFDTTLSGWKLSTGDQAFRDATEAKAYHGELDFLVAERDSGTLSSEAKRIVEIRIAFLTDILKTKGWNQ